MAMTEDEARRIAEAFNELSNVTAGRTKEEQAAAEATRLFDAKMTLATTTIGGLVKATAAYNRALYDGEKGAKAFAASTDAMASSIEAIGVALAVLLPVGRIAKAVIAGLGLLAGEAARTSKIFGEQADNLQSAFNKFAQLGLTGAEGMEGVFKQIQDFGLNLKDADHVAKLMGENATTMALFGKTTRDGYLEFNQTVKGLEQFRAGFLSLGLDQKAQIEAAMGLRKQQQLLTMGTKAQMEVSSVAVKRYVEETDRLTRITGLTRQQQEKAVEDALSNQAYGATIANLQDEGTDASRRSVEQFNKIQKILSAIGPEMEKAGQDAAGGFVGASDRAGKLFQASNGKYQALVEDIQNKRITSDEELAARVDDVLQTIGRTEKAFRGQQQMMNAETFLLSGQESRKAATMGMKGILEALKASVPEQAGAIKGDETQKTLIALRIKQQEEELKLQKDVQGGVLNYMKVLSGAGGAMNGLTDAARKAAEALGIIGGSKSTGGAPGTTPGGAQALKSEATVQAQTEVNKIRDKVTAAKTELEANKKAQEKAKADLQTVLMENKSDTEIKAAKQKIADLVKQEAKIKETVVEQEKAQRNAQKKAFEQQTIDRQLLYKAKGDEKKVTDLQEKITSNKQGLATLRDARYELDKDIAAKEAKANKTGFDIQQINQLKDGLTNINNKIAKREKDLGEVEKQLSAAQKTVQSAKKALPTAATETVNIDIDREKFAKVDQENFEKYEARKKELYDKELKEIEADTNLDARQRARLREKATRMAEEAAAKEFAAKIKAAGAGQVTVTKAPAAPTAGAPAAPETTAAAPAAPTAGAPAAPTAAAPAAPTAPAVAKGSKGPEAHDPVGAGGGGKNTTEEKPKLTRVNSKSGKGASVNEKYASNFQNLINYLDGQGYEINSLGGYIDRDVRGQPGVKSIHAHGAAIDINPSTNPMGSTLITDMPADIGNIAKQMGLGWGGNWTTPKDAMHFSMAKSEGGVVELKDGGVVPARPGGTRALIGEGGQPEAVIPLKGGAVPVNIGGFDKFAGTMTQYLNAQSKLSEKLYARPTDMAAGLVKSSLNTEEGTIQSKLIDTTVSKVVGSIPGVKELGSILNIAETLQSDKISTAEKVLEIAKLLNPTVRMVSKLYDVYNKVDAVTTALKAPEEPAVAPIDKPQVTRPEEPKFTELKIPLEGIAKQLSGSIPGGDRVSIAKDFDQDVMNKLSEQKATPLTPTVAPPTDTANFREMTDVMKQTASMNEAMVGMMAELVRQQQTSNDISNKMLRVAQN